MNKKNSYKELIQSDQKIQELTLNLQKLENDNLNNKRIIEEKDELINFIKQENETLNDQYYSLESKIKETQKAKNYVLKSINTDVKSMMEKILDSVSQGNYDNSASKISDLYKFLIELLQNIQDYKDPLDLNLESHNNSNNNLYFEEENKKGSSYITQNYEKYKQQMNKDNKGLNKSFNELKVKSNSQIKLNVNNISSSNINPYTNTNNNSILNSNSNSNTNSSFVTHKSNIIQNLINKTPNKYNTVISNSNQLSSNKFNKSGSNVKSNIPNPLTLHLKSSSNNNDMFVNKFILNNK